MRERLLRRGFADDVVEDVMGSTVQDCSTTPISPPNGYGRDTRTAARGADRTQTGAAFQRDRRRGHRRALGDISPDAERVNAVSMATKKLAGMRVDLTDRAERDKAFRRLAGVLSRRSYDQSTVIDVVTEVLGTRS